MDITWESSWISWIGAVTTCLKALGIDCDRADVAGYSGYAFMLSVHDELCPSGPTVFPWGELTPGIHRLGRSTVTFHSNECYNKEKPTEEMLVAAKQGYEIASREIAEGRPCVIWGAYMPEFAAVEGVDDGHYMVRSFKEACKEEQPPIKWDDLDAPGGIYVLGFPGRTGFSKLHADQYAIGHAVWMLKCPSVHHKYSMGIKAYDRWIDALKENKAHPFGNAYNAQCYSEGRHLAHKFLERLRDRNEVAARPLGKAVEAYAEARDAMKVVAELFPFPPGEQVKDEKTRKEAIEALKDAKKAEKKALEALEDANKVDWPKE